MENVIFKVGQRYGNDLTLEVVKRTEKTVTIKTNTWGVKRVKLRSFENANATLTESIHFKAWVIYASEEFDAKEAEKISYYNAYNR